MYLPEPMPKLFTVIDYKDLGSQITKRQRTTAIFERERQLERQLSALITQMRTSDINSIMLSQELERQRQESERTAEEAQERREIIELRNMFKQSLSASS